MSSEIGRAAEGVINEVRSLRYIAEEEIAEARHETERLKNENQALTRLVEMLDPDREESEIEPQRKTRSATETACRQLRHACLGDCVRWEGTGPQLSKAISIAVGKLSFDQMAAVVLYHGLDGRGPRTFRTVGVALGISGTRARDIVSKAHRALRHRSLNRFFVKGPLTEEE